MEWDRIASIREADIPWLGYLITDSIMKFNSIKSIGYWMQECSSNMHRFLFNH